MARAGGKHSTAMKLDAAFKRTIKLQRKKNLPLWGTLEELNEELDKQANTDEMQTWRQVLTFQECQQLMFDLELINRILGPVPYDKAGRVK